MITSPEGIAAIKAHEGLRLEAYRCPADVWTIGYGHTGPDVQPGLVIDEAEAERLLREDLFDFERCVQRLVRVALTQGQFDALVSFAYNLGCRALETSTLLRLLNAGDYAGARAQFGRWTKAGGRELPGLVARRADEAERFA